MRYSVSQAAKTVGKSKATLHRAIQAGRISVVRDDATGALRVDAAELYRVFPLASDLSHEAAETSNAPPHEVSRDSNATFNEPARDETVHARLLAAETRIGEMHARLHDKDATIEDLRRRLDRADERLADALAQVRLLTDQRQAAPPAPPRRSWWPWGRRA